MGPSAGPLLHAVVKKRKVPKAITGLSVVTVVAGWVMWSRNLTQYGSLGNWVSTEFGLALTIGGVLATVAAIEGSLLVGRNVERLVDLSDEVAASGGPPSPEQQSQIQRVGAEIEKWGKIDLVLLLLAVAAMATASYW